MKLLNNAHTQLLAKMMDVYSLRNKMTASNIANIETPGYKRIEVSFEDALASKLDSGTRSKSVIRGMQPRVEETIEAPQLEDELLEMADTQMRVQLTTRALRHNFEQMRMGITGRT